MYEDHMEEFVWAYRGLKSLFQGETKGAHNSQTRHFDNEKFFFQNVFVEKASPLCLRFKI